MTNGLHSAFSHCRAVALAAALLVPSLAATADELAEAQDTVDKARRTIETFKADPDMAWFRDHVQDAKALMIVPVLLKGGFIFGGSGGNGVLLGRDTATGEWSDPAFNFIGSVTFGLQIGAEAAEVVLMVMTERGKSAMLSTEFKLGADVSIAAGPIGAGASAATTDVLAFSREKGLFGGLTIEGAVIKPRDSWNAAYYGTAAEPIDIVVRRIVSNSRADGLRAAVARTSGGAPAAAAPVPYDLAAIQRALAAKGYDPGAADGVMGAKTRDAIRRYQQAEGLTVTSEPSIELQRILAAP